MDERWHAAHRALAGDARSGASELLPKAIELLRAIAAQSPASLDEVAGAVGAAQPSMMPFWNAALAALRDARDTGALDRFEARRHRAGAAVVRVAADALAPSSGRLHLITCSFSGTVLACAKALARRCELHVSCAEGRPALEGQRLAVALAGEGIDVSFHSDAGIGTALQDVDRGECAVLAGADAVTPDWFINKTGTGMLAASAVRHGVPVYVAAGRDKFADRRVARLVRIAEHPPEELWDRPPAGVAVRNFYFERVPAELASGFLTDAGVLDAGMLEEACRAASAEVTDAEIARLAVSSRQ